MKEKLRQETEASSKQKKQFIEMQQRNSALEHSYNDLNNKYQELQSSNQSLQNDYFTIQSLLDSERSALSHESFQSQELAGRQLLVVVIGVVSSSVYLSLATEAGRSL